jgi:3-isopropylmalate dehydratase large subunit
LYWNEHHRKDFKSTLGG